MPDYGLPCCNDPCPNAGTKTCARCDINVYCSRECQKKDWKTHKSVCYELAEDRAETCREIGSDLEKEGRYEEALVEFRTAVKIYQDIGVDDFRLANTHKQVADVLRKNGQCHESRIEERKCLEIHRELFGVDNDLTRTLEKMLKLKEFIDNKQDD